MNNISQKKYHSFFKTVILLFISLILALVFCESTSPLYIVYGNDGIEYKLAGSAILDGCVMFKDIFHQKGVLFFYVESIGEFFKRFRRLQAAWTPAIRFRAMPDLPSPLSGLQQQSRHPVALALPQTG